MTKGLKLGLSLLCLGTALYVWVNYFLFSDYLDSWLPYLAAMVLVWWGIAFALPLKQQDTLTDADIAHWLFSTFYIGLFLIVNLFIWGNLLNNYFLYDYYAVRFEVLLYEIQLWSAPQWGFLLGGVLLMQGSWRFFQSQSGKHLCQVRWFQGFSFTLLMSILTLVALELALRHPYVMHHLVGPYPIHLAAEYEDRRQEIGSLGEPFAIPKPDEHIRILFMGDSYTFGWGVYDKDRFPVRFEALVPEDVEVGVSAIGGLSTNHEYQRWLMHGTGMEADIVIIGVVTNDPDMAIIPQASRIRPAYVKWHELFPNSSLALYVDIQNWFARQEANAEEGLAYDDWEAALYSDPENQRLWVETVQALYESITATGAQAWAYILASPVYAEDRSQIPLHHPKYDHLEAVFRAAGFRTYNFYPDILADFQPDSPKQYCAFPNDCHPNAEVHDYYAQKIWADLEPVLEELRAQ